MTSVFILFCPGREVLSVRNSDDPVILKAVRSNETAANVSAGSGCKI